MTTGTFSVALSLIRIFFFSWQSPMTLELLNIRGSPCSVVCDKM